MLDVGVAARLLLAMIPLFAVIALAIKLDSPGPVLYRVRRVGYRGRPLLTLKFRKMHDDATGGLGTIEPALGAQPLPDQTRDLAPVGPSSGLAHHEPH